MRERCVGSRIMVATIAGTAAVISASTDRTSAQAPPSFPAAPAPAGAENGLGRARSAGHLDRRERHASAAPRQICQPRILHPSATRPT
jgi:hypothetical protein